MSSAAGTANLAMLIGTLIRRHGEGLLEDRRRLHGLLRDYAPAPEAARDIRLMMTAFDAGLVGRLKGAGAMPDTDTLGREAATLVELYGCRADLAREAVSGWARVCYPAAPALAGAPLPLPLPTPAAAQPPFTATTGGRIAIAAGLAVVVVIAARAAGWI